MRRTRRVRTLTWLFAVSALACGLVVFGGPKQGLRSELIVNKSDWGIPGISKSYGARLVNKSFWPIGVHYCAFVDDSSIAGKIATYAVERWEGASRSWKPIARMGSAEICPSNFRIQTRIGTMLLWPGQSLSTGEEATAARDGLHIGDRVRFVIFPDATEELSSAIATPDFIIDENRTNKTPLLTGRFGAWGFP